MKLHLPTLSEVGQFQYVIFFSRLDEKVQSNATKYEDWQNKANDVDKWLVTIQTEIKSVEVPSSDVNEREKQKKVLEVST